MKDFFSFCKRRVKSKGEVATVVANYLRPNTVKVSEGNDDDEYIVVQLDHVNIVTIYGQQECRTARG